MRRKYLVLKEVADCKNSAGSYAVLSVVELDERVVRGTDVLSLPESIAQQLRELLRQHVGKPETR